MTNSLFEHCGKVVALLLGLCSISVCAAAPTPASLGQKIFNDTTLSASGQQSCASCHVPARAHSQANGLPAQLGGADLDVAGFRSVPSLRYLNTGIAFFFDDEGTPVGGFNRDGRAQSLLEQAQRPFLAPHEMANGTPFAVVSKVRVAAYADEFRQVYGDDALVDIDGAFFRVLFSLEQFESTAREFHPFDSKYDLFLKGRVKLAPAELRGLALYNRSDKGNCAGCHPSARGAKGELPLFTDFTYDNLGVPRNPELPATADPAYFDLGLCGPDRADLADRADLCGAFKVPTLRNVATRQVFFHNGFFKTLLETLRFYVRRDTNPDQFYPRAADGAVLKFDDLPANLTSNVNTAEVPYDRKPGQAPRLSEAEIADVVAFLGTLTDGYDTRTNTADPARSVAPR